MCHSVIRFWSQAPNFLPSEAQAVVPSPPDVRETYREGGVDHLTDGCAKRVLLEIAAADVQELGVGHIVVARYHAFDTGVGAKSVQTEQQALLQGFPVEVLPASQALEGIGEANPKIGFLEHVKKAGHGPAPADFGFEAQKLYRLRLRIEGGHNDTFFALGAQPHHRIFRKARIELAEPRANRFSHRFSS
jgi:hypothetical protein